MHPNVKFTVSKLYSNYTVYKFHCQCHWQERWGWQQEQYAQGSQCKGAPNSAEIKNSVHQSHRSLACSFCCSYYWLQVSLLFASRLWCWRKLENNAHLARVPYCRTFLRSETPNRRLQLACMYVLCACTKRSLRSPQNTLFWGRTPRLPSHIDNTVLSMPCTIYSCRPTFL